MLDNLDGGRAFVNQASLPGVSALSGFNPYRFGLIGSSDSHTGIVPANEYDYSGKIGAVGGSPEARLKMRRATTHFVASGRAGVRVEDTKRQGNQHGLRR